MQVLRDMRNELQKDISAAASKAAADTAELDARVGGVALFRCCCHQLLLLFGFCCCLGPCPLP